MRTLRAVQLAALVSGVTALSSHTPLDLLAYPAYSVQLRPDHPVSNSTAEQLLAASRDAYNPQLKKDIMSNELLHIQAQSPSTLASASDDETTKHKTFLMKSSGSGQGYLCTVPQSVQPKRQGKEDKKIWTSEERAERRRQAEEAKRQGYQKGLVALEPLMEQCLYLTQGWFTYAFCHGSEIRQFRATKTPSGGITADLAHDSYTLGQFASRQPENEGLVDTNKARSLGSLREILDSEDKSHPHSLSTLGPSSTNDDDDVFSEQKRYLVQQWSGGTLCDKTGLERRVEVQFHCNSQSPDRIFLIRETAICEYVLVIHTPRLCGDPIFVGGTAEDEAETERKRKSVSVIECWPIVKDEQLATIQAKAEPPTNADVADTLKVRSTQVPVSAEEQEISAQQHLDQIEQSLEVEQGDPGKSTASVEKLQSQQSEDAFPNKPQDTITTLFDGLVVVVDPATGDLIIEADPNSITSQNGGQEGSDKVDAESKSLEAMETLVQMVRKSMEAVLEQVANGPSLDEKDSKTGSDGEAELQQDQSQGKDGLKRPRKPKGGDSLSRLSKSSTYNSKEVVEKFLQGQLGSHHRRHTRNKIQYPPSLQQGVNEQRSLSTPQQQELKKAFEKTWGDLKDKQEDEGEPNSASGMKTEL